MNATILAILSIAAKNPDGFTVNANTLQAPAGGYAVALAATQNSFGLDGLKNVLNHVGPDTGAMYVGGWLDRETGLYYYDATVVVDDRRAAEELGRLNGQIAIFDLNHMEEIRL